MTSESRKHDAVRQGSSGKAGDDNVTRADLCEDCNEQPAVDREDYCEGCIGHHTCVICGQAYDVLPTGLLCLACAVLDEML